MPDSGCGFNCKKCALRVSGLERDRTLMGQGDSTASQTAWALTGLLAAGEALGTYETVAMQQASSATV